MANFTQLHLGSGSGKEPSKNSAREKKYIYSKEKTLFGAGLLAVTVMSGVFLLITNGCSKGASKNTGIESPSAINSATAPPVITQSSTPAAALPVVTPKPAKKVQRKAPMATYMDPAYGVSFRYPKSYILKKGDDLNKGDQKSEVMSAGTVQNDFTQPGGVNVARIELPRSSYPGTDFTSGFFSVSVNSSLTKEQCEQFAFPKSEHPENQPGSVSKVKIAGVDYVMVEDFGSSEKKEPHLKYFHHFENGNCYEYGLGVGTVDDSVAGLKPVNRSLVFGRLEQMLASVKLQPVAVPEVAKDVPAHPMAEGGKQ
jgi:hypothetical protein